MFLSYRGFLSKDTTLYVTNFLEPHDIHALFKAWRISWKYFIPLYENAIKRKIDGWFRNYFGPRYASFRACMIEDRAVISGSFVLQNILGQTWKNSDIDIYIGKANRKHEYDSKAWFKGIGHFLYFTKGLSNEGCYTPCPRYDEEIGYENLFEVRDYTINNKLAQLNCDTEDIRFFGKHFEDEKDVQNYVQHRYFSGPEYVGTTPFTQFQVMELRKDATIEAIVNFVNEIFDFDICKNCFYYDEKGCHIILHNIHDLITKSTTFKYARAANSSANRYLKYTKRGISFTNEEEALRILDSFEYHHKYIKYNEIRRN